MSVFILFINLLGSVLSFPVFSVTSPFSQNQLKPFEAKIETETIEDKLNITAKFYNYSDSTYSLFYDMESKKISGSGKSSSNQSGKFRSEPNAATILTKVGLNVEEDAHYEIILKIFEGEKLILTDSLSFISNH